MANECVVYRCGRQDELYLYVRADIATDSLPAALLKKTGKLTKVMTLNLDARRKLARADAAKVVAALAKPGYYLQMPPEGHIRAHLHFGDGL